MISKKCFYRMLGKPDFDPSYENFNEALGIEDPLEDVSECTDPVFVNIDIFNLTKSERAFLCVLTGYVNEKGDLYLDGDLKSAIGDFTGVSLATVERYCKKLHDHKIINEYAPDDYPNAHEMNPFVFAKEVGTALQKRRNNFFLNYEVETEDYELAQYRGKTICFNSVETLELYKKYNWAKLFIKKIGKCFFERKPDFDPSFENFNKIVGTTKKGGEPNFVSIDIYNLTKKQMALLFALTRDIDDRAKIKIYKVNQSKLAYEIGISQKTFKEYLKKFCDYQIMKKDDEEDCFELNPFLFSCYKNISVEERRKPFFYGKEENAK